MIYTIIESCNSGAASLDIALRLKILAFRFRADAIIIISV